MGHLTTGWEADAEVGDTLLRREVFNLAARYRMCRERLGVDGADDDDLVAVRLSERGVWGNDAILLQPRVGDDGATLVKELEARLGWESLVWSAWPTPDLAAHGLQAVGHPPWMYRPPGGAVPSDPAGVSIVEVDDERGMADYDAVVIRGFPLMYSDGTYLERILDPRLLGGPWRFYVAYADGDPASVASAFVAEGVVQVEWVATVPEHRGRGLGEAVTWRATLAEPSLPSTLIASDMGRPIYERMGFVPIHRVSLWHWKGAAE